MLFEAFVLSKQLLFVIRKKEYTMSRQQSGEVDNCGTQNFIYSTV